MGVQEMCERSHPNLSFSVSLPPAISKYTPSQITAAAAAAAALLRAPTNTVCTLPLGLCNSFVNLLDTQIHVG